MIPQALFSDSIKLMTKRGVHISKVTDFLKEWTVRHFKNRDLMLQNIEDIKEAEEYVDIKYKDRLQRYYLIGFLTDDNFSKIKNDIAKDQFCTIILFNTRANLDFVVKAWNDLIKNRKLSIMFINPFSKTDKLWSFYPATHNYIAEGKGIKSGLSALFMNVDESTEQELRKIIES